MATTKTAKKTTSVSKKTPAKVVKPTKAARSSFSVSDLQKKVLDPKKLKTFDKKPQAARVEM